MISAHETAWARPHPVVEPHRIEVEDNGGPWTVARSDPTRHHGLDIIRALATDWGINGDHTTRTI
jgi:hypothetical protein